MRFWDSSAVVSLLVTEAATAQLVRSWHEVAPTPEVRNIARRIVQAYPLRSADALQLAAALTVRGRHAALDFVCSDRQLAAAARLEGLTIAAAIVAQEPEASSYEIVARRGVIEDGRSRPAAPVAGAKAGNRRIVPAGRRKGESRQRP